MEQLFQQIANLSHDDFEELMAYVDKLKKKRARIVITEARNKARWIAKKYGVDLDEILSTTQPKKIKRPMKYQNPHNPQQQWNGFGRKPDWFKEEVAKGVSPEELLIKG